MYEWRGHAVWLSHEQLREIEVATLYYFVSDSCIQTGLLDDSDSETSFFPNVNDGNFVALPSVHVTTLGSFGR